MAPEALYGKSQTTVSDYYSLGVLAYELLFGVKPYKGKNRDEIKAKIREMNLNRNNFEKINLSKESFDFIEKFAKDPDFSLRDEISERASFFDWSHFKRNAEKLIFS